MGFNLLIPVNLHEITDTVVQVTSFDILSEEEIYSNTYEFTDTEPPSEGMETLGYQSQNFLLNSGTLFLMLQAWVVLALFATLLKFLATKLCKPDSRSYRFSLWLDRQLKWNFFYEMFLTSQIDLFASALVQLKYWGWTTKNGDRAALVFAVITCAYILISTAYMYLIIRTTHKKKLFEHPHYEERFGHLTEG